MVQLLKVFNAVESEFFKSLKINCSKITVCSSSMQPILINNCNMTGNSVEKIIFCCVECKIISKT